MNSKWRMVLVVVVALVVGAGAGAYGEHVRLKHSSDKKSASTATTRPPGGVPANLFGAKTKQACPALRQASAAQVAMFRAIASKAPWKTTSATLVAQSAAAVKAYQALMPFATPAGQATLRFMVTYMTGFGNAAKKATSVATYQKATLAQQSFRSQRSNNVIAHEASTCAAA